MKNYYFFLTTILTLLFFSLNSYSVSAQSSCGTTINVPLNGSITVGGNTVTNAANTGSVITYPFSSGSGFASCIPGESLSAGSFLVGDPGAYSTTYTFSEPVNDIVFLIAATGFNGNENFIFTTNGGATTISLGDDCGFETIVGSNQLRSGAGTTASTGSGGAIVIVNAASSYTSLTVSGSGGLFGSVIAICEASVAKVIAVDDDFTGSPIAAGDRSPTVFTNDYADGTSPAINALVTTPTVISDGGLTGVTFNANGRANIPAGAGAGTYTVTYEICLETDNSICDQGDVMITVSIDTDTDGDGNPDSTDPNPGTPTAANDTGTGNPAVGTAVDVLANDDYLANADVNNAGITTITDAGTGTAVGTVGIDNTTGEITYTPTAGEAGTTVSIDYQVCNDASGSAVCATASLNFTVGDPDTDGDGNPDSTDPNSGTPTAANDTGIGNPAVGTAVDVLANDDYLANGDPTNLGITTITDAGTGTAVGTVAINNTTGEITYTPTAGETGTTVSIDYQVCNDASGSAVCATASLNFTVGDPDTDGDGNPDSTDPNSGTPTAANDTGIGNPAVGTAVDVLANDDYLANGDPTNLGITTITDAGTGTAVGTVAINNTTGEITYTPTAGETGTTVSIDYQVCNDASGSAVCATASLNFTVGDPDTDGDGNPDSTDPNSGTPTAANDTGTGNPDVGTAVDVLANDDYLDNAAPNNLGTTTITDEGTGTAAGTVAINNTTGEITYTPTAGESETTVSIDYQVCNDASGSAVCATASLNFTVGSLCNTGIGGPILIKN